MITAATVKKEPTITIEMSYTEACLLRDVMQNPLFGETPDTEATNLGSLRSDLFEALVDEVGHGKVK